MTAIFHITHIENLPKIIDAGALRSDRRVIAEDCGHTVIGYQHIKLRRLNEIAVSHYPGTTVGDFVPFYFCPRSPMLFLIEKNSSSPSAEMRYRGGQRDVVHLVSTVETAVALGLQVAFTPSNAGARHCKFYADVDDLDAVLNWTAIKAKNWKGVMEQKMAEFLVRDEFPWGSIESIGVMSLAAKGRVEGILADAEHQPPVAVRSNWYY